MDFGILGTADIASGALVPAIRASEHAVGAVASRDPDRARAFADEHGIDRWYGSYEALLDDDELDAVYVPLPNGLHATWTRRAADAGLDVLCEKPLTPDADEAAALFEYCAERDVALMEAFMYHFHPRTVRAREIVREELGEIRHVAATFTFDLGDRTEDVRLDPELAGGSLLDVGCYAVSAARALLGEPDAAFAHAADSYDAGVDSQCSGTLTYEDGAVAQVTGGFDTPHTEDLRVLAEDGWLRATDAYGPDADQSVSLTWAVDGEERTERFDPVDHYRLQVEAFAEAVAAGETPPVGPEETVNNLRVLDALAASAERGEVVTIDSGG